MTENKFTDFFRSPAGVLLTIGIIMVAAILVFLFVSSVFRDLINPVPYIVE